MHFWWAVVIIVIGSIAAYMILELLKNCTMSEAAIREKMQTQDMIEMSELMKDRYYNEEAGKILLPAGV